MVMRRVTSMARSRGRWCRLVVAGASFLVGLPLVVGAGTADAVAVRVGTANVTVPCGSSGTTLSADWYFPAVASDRKSTRLNSSH